MYTLEARDGQLFARQASINEWKPREDINWYRLTTSLAKFRSWFSGEEQVNKALGGQLWPTINPATVWRDDRGWLYRLDGDRTPAHYESIAIPAPATRARSLVWHKGAWHKETKKGLVKLA